MTLDLALIADAATVDGSGKLNILGIFDHISAAEFPARHERMCMVLRFHANADEVGEHQVEVVIREPQGQEMARMSGSIELGPFVGPEGTHIPQILNVDGFIFPQPGLYVVDIEIDGDIEGQMALRLSRATPIPEA